MTSVKKTRNSTTMTDYEYNDDKPEKLLTGYNTVRGAELREVYQVLDQQGDVPASAFEQRFGRPNADSSNINTAHVDRCLKFLRAIDMVEISAQGIVSLTNRDVYPNIEAFEPRLLHHIRQQQGEQYHLSHIFDVVVSLDRRRIPEEEVLEEVVSDDTRSFGFDWNDDNIRMWANLADPIGAISYLNRGDTNRVLVSPTRKLLVDLLLWYQNNGDDPDRFARALEWIHEEFFPVFREGASTTVSVGVADVLNDMEAEGALSLRPMSDTEDVVEVPRSSREGSRNVATFTVKGVPDRPSYQYPLARNEWRVDA